MIGKDAGLVPEPFAGNLKRKPMRDGYGEGLLELGRSDPRVWVLSADVTGFTGIKRFAEEFPERFIEVGVAEQNMAGVAAGLALEGKIPFASSFACFSPGRNWDQIRISVAYSEANVKIVGSHAGLAVGDSGAVYQAAEDIAMMRALPNMVVIAPCDALEVKRATVAAAERVGPVYIRLAAGSAPVFTTEEMPFEIGKAVLLSEGQDVGIIACGNMVYQSLLAAEELFKEGISALVVDMHTIKPLDEEAVEKAAAECGCIVTAEEHQVFGGVGSAVAEFVGERHPVPLEIVGINDAFGESGKAAELWQKYGLTSASIAEAARRAIARKERVGRRKAA